MKSIIDLIWEPENEMGTESSAAPPSQSLSISCGGGLGCSCVWPFAWKLC